MMNIILYIYIYRCEVRRTDAARDDTSFGNLFPAHICGHMGIYIRIYVHIRFLRTYSRELLPRLCSHAALISAKMQKSLPEDIQLGIASWGALTRSIDFCKNTEIASRGHTSGNCFLGCFDTHH